VEVIGNVRKRKEENRQRVIEERKNFVCGRFRHIACHCRNRKEKELVSMPSNKFEILKDKVMQREKDSRK